MVTRGEAEQTVDPLEKILIELGLGHLVLKFKEEKINLPIVSAASDDDLKVLGEKCLGDRIRLRSSCQKHQSFIPSPRNVLSAANSRVNAIREERSFLFNPRGGAQRRTSSGTSSSSNNNKRKAKPITWTGKFICLADRFAQKVPSPSQKVALENAGLGFRKIVFDIEDTEEEVYKKLLSSTLI